jgi:hypothetical protein
LSGPPFQALQYVSCIGIDTPDVACLVVRLTR